MGKGPSEPRYTWEDVLLAMDKEWGQHTEFTSRALADLLDISITDASQRLKRSMQWGTVQHVRTEKHNAKVYVISNYGVKRINILKEER